MIINSRKSDGGVVDVNQSYDDRFFYNETFADGTIPGNDRPEFYRRVDATTIQRYNTATIEAMNRGTLESRLRGDIQALVTALVADITALPAGPQKQIFAQMLQLIRKLNVLNRME